MDKPKILLQLDTDPQPNVFDAVVAIDAGVEHLLRHGGVTPATVRDLIYGGMFTRSPGDLKSTAVFIGGSNVAAAEAVFAEVRRTFFGPLRLSVLLDNSGANTTAAAAVLAAAGHLELKDATALVLGATGPVGGRVARLLARAGAIVRVGSRDRQKAAAICRSLSERVPSAQLSACATQSESELRSAVDGVRLVISAGAPGVTLLPAELRRSCATLEVAIDLNAVPPLGIAGVEVNDRGQARDQIITYGAEGIGRLKMKIHKRAIERLFESNDQVLDAEEVFEIGRGIVK